MKPAQIAALAKVMATHGVTRLQVGDVVLERPLMPVRAAEETRGKVSPTVESAIAKMRASKEYKTSAAGGPLLVGEQ